MKPVNALIFLLVYILSFAYSSGQTKKTDEISISSAPNSKHLIVGETNYIRFKFTGLKSYPRAEKFQLKGATMRYKYKNAHRQNGQTSCYLYYSFQASKPGIYTIPKIKFHSNIGVLRSKQIKIHVHSPDKLVKKQATANKKKFTYYTLLKPYKDSIFPNETTPVEYKVYVPSKLHTANWTLPLGKTKNCTSWRFTTPTQQQYLNTAKINRRNYTVGTFRTALTALKQGDASIGPLKSKLTHIATIPTNFGFKRITLHSDIESATTSINVKPLPPNPPKHFRGDVGTYKLTLSSDAPSQINERDSIELTAQLKGTGNIATVKPPIMLDTQGWKLISQSRTELGEKRKSTSGTAEFTYLIQPDTSEHQATTTPSFVFSSLDPNTGKYNTTRIPGNNIRLIARQPSKPAPELPYDELIMAPQASYTLPWYRRIPIYLIHILPAGFIFTTLIKRFKQKLRARSSARSDILAKRKAIAELEKTDTHFLKRAGNYIEHWIDTDKHPKAKDILSLRDDFCFQPNKKLDLSDKRKKKIIATLRDCSLILITFTLLLSEVHAQVAPVQNIPEVIEHVENKDYKLAIETLLKLPDAQKNPDILYNLGFCHQLNKDPGMAAYYYSLALKLNSQHSSSVKNLQHLQATQHSIRSQSLAKQERWIQTFTPKTYLHLIAFSLGVLFCLAIVFVSLKPRSAFFNLSCVLSFCSLLLLAGAIWGYAYHPERSTYLLEPALVIQSAELKTQPVEFSQVITNIPPASHCHILATRGRFSYILLANGKQGWIPEKSIRSY